MKFLFKLGKEDYEYLKKNGWLYQLYPEACGDWELDSAASKNWYDEWMEQGKKLI